MPLVVSEICTWLDEINLCEYYCTFLVFFLLIFFFFIFPFTPRECSAIRLLNWSPPQKKVGRFRKVVSVRYYPTVRCECRAPLKMHKRSGQVLDKKSFCQLSASHLYHWQHTHSGESLLSFYANTCLIVWHSDAWFCKFKCLFEIFSGVRKTVISSTLQRANGEKQSCKCWCRQQLTVIYMLCMRSYTGTYEKKIKSTTCYI